MTEKEQQVIKLIYNYGGIDGAHHKQWLLDQIVRTLTEDDYEKWIAIWNEGDDGPNTYEWDEGVAP